MSLDDSRAPLAHRSDHLAALRQAVPHAVASQPRPLNVDEVVRHTLGLFPQGRCAEIKAQGLFLVLCGELSMNERWQVFSARKLDEPHLAP